MDDFNDRIDADRVQRPDDAATHEPQHRGVGVREGAPAETAAARDGRAQAEKILASNHELVEGEAEAGPEGERAVGVGRTMNSDNSHRGGDYSSD